jgi:hypothetical protein
MSTWRSDTATTTTVCLTVLPQGAECNVITAHAVVHVTPSILVYAN